MTKPSETAAFHVNDQSEQADTVRLINRNIVSWGRSRASKKGWESRKAMKEARLRYLAEQGEGTS